MIEELTAQQRWLWIGFLLLAGDSSIPGTIFRRKDADGLPIGFSDITLAEMLDVEPDVYADGIHRMTNKGKISIDDKGVIHILNWTKYQSEYQRQKPYRESDRKDCNQSDDVDIDIEREVEVDTEKTIVHSKRIDALFERWWERYPNKQDKGKAKEKWVHLVKVGKVDPQRLEDALTGYINCIKSKQTAPEYIKMAKTFLYPGKPDKGIPGTWEEFLPYAKEKPKPPVGTNIKPPSSREEEYRKARDEFIKTHGDDKDTVAGWSQEWWEKHE
jgi:hypothetical protein